MILTAEQREYFDQNGYLVFDPEIPDSVLDAIVNDLKDKYTSDEQLDVGHHEPGRIQDAWRINSHVKDVALNPKVLAVLAELYDRKPLPFQTLNFPVGTQQQPHSDTIHFNSVPAGFMCGVWIALEDMDENNGTLIYYPGSHKLPEFTMKDVGYEYETRSAFSVSQFLRRGFRKFGIIKSTPSLKVDDAYPLYEKYISEAINENELKPELAVIEKGQGFIWSANLLHGGSPLKDKARTRHSQVTHYFFEDCKYYTPLASNSEFKSWRDPVWIS